MLCMTEGFHTTDSKSDVACLWIKSCEAKSALYASMGLWRPRPETTWNCNDRSLLYSAIHEMAISLAEWWVYTLAAVYDKSRIDVECPVAPIKYDSAWIDAVNVGFWRWWFKRNKSTVNKCRKFHTEIPTFPMQCFWMFTRFCVYL